MPSPKNIVVPLTDIVRLEKVTILVLFSACFAAVTLVLGYQDKGHYSISSHFFTLQIKVLPIVWERKKRIPLENR